MDGFRLRKVNEDDPEMSVLGDVLIWVEDNVCRVGVLGEINENVAHVQVSVLNVFLDKEVDCSETLAEYFPDDGKFCFFVNI